MSVLPEPRNYPPYFVSLLFCPIALFSVILFGQKWVPPHDTLSDLLHYHYLLSGIAKSGELPLWNPLLNWGRDNSLLFLIHISPVQFLLTPIIYFFPELNVIHLFYFAIALEEMVFVWGCYLLSRLFYRNYISIAFVTLSLSGTAIWLGQIFFNFRIYYALPLIWFFFVKATRTRMLRPLLIGTFLLLITGVMGTAIYPIIIQILVSAIFFFLVHYAEGRKLLRDWKKTNLADFLGIVGLLLVLATFYCFIQAGGLFEFVSPGRSQSGGSSYEKFVQLDKAPNIQGFSGIYDSLNNDLGYGFDYNATGYGGIVVLPLALFALLMNPSRALLPFLINALLLFFFWMGRDSFLAPLMFYLPGVSFFRQNFLVTSLIKMQLVFIAGFGFDFLTRKLDDKIGPRKSSLTLLFVFLPFFFLFLGRLKPIYHYYASSLVVLVFFIAYLVAILILVIHGERHRSLVIKCLLIIAVLDVFSYKMRLFHKYMLPATDSLWALFQPRTNPFIESRTENYFNNKNFTALHPSIERLGEFYNITESFVGLDPCHSIFRQDTADPNVVMLYREFKLPHKIPEYLAGGHSNLSLWNFPLGLRKTIGCESPKLKIFQSAASTSSDTEALKKIRGASGSILLLHNDGKPEPSLTSDLGIPISVVNFSSNSLAVETDLSQGHRYWLYYADAWHGSWKATINGYPTTIHRANVAFKAVEIPGGKSHIEFKYSSPLLSGLYFALWVLSLGFAFIVLGIRLLFPES